MPRRSERLASAGRRLKQRSVYLERRSELTSAYLECVESELKASKKARASLDRQLQEQQLLTASLRVCNLNNLKPESNNL